MPTGLKQSYFSKSATDYTPKIYFDMNDIFEGKKCTFYKQSYSIDDKFEGRTVNVLDLLTNERYTNHKLLSELRSSGYKSDFYNKNKYRLSCACFSSLQNDNKQHSEQNHLSHTGFLAFDIDQKDNPQLSTTSGFNYVKDCLISEVPYLAYLGSSVSGLGLWGLIPVSDRDNHDGHFHAMIKMFAGHNIVLDSVVSNVVAYRFLSYDPEAHFELNPEVFEEVAEAPVKSNAYTTGGLQRLNPPHELFIAACRWIEQKHEILFEPGFRHKYLTFLYATLRYARISHEDVRAWVFDNLISEGDVNSNCLDDIEVKSKL
jgi:hypothetical protein